MVPLDTAMRTVELYYTNPAFLVVMTLAFVSVAFWIMPLYRLVNLSGRLN